MKILIIEDDDHKLADVIACVRASGFDWQISTARSVRDGGMYLRSNSVDFIVLDMSLPNFDPQISGSGGSARPQGGIEILEDLRYYEIDTPIVVLTQYEDLIVEDKTVSLNKGKKILRKSFSANVIKVIHYNNDGNEWSESLTNLMERLYEDSSL